MRRYQQILGAAVLAALLSLGSFIFLLPDRTVSEHENRTLQTMPEWSMEGFLDTSVQTKLASYLSDQFPGREYVMATATKLKLLLGMKDIENTYIGENGYYFDKVTDQDIDQARYEKNLSRINALAEKFYDISFTTMLVPSAGVVLSENLPQYATVYDADAMYERAKEVLTLNRVVNPLSQLKAVKDEYIYYRTDHHWTAFGAYVAYQAYMENQGNYDWKDAYTVTDSFLGTLYSRTLDDQAQADTIMLAKVPESVQVTINGKEDEMYPMKQLKEKDKYKVFFGGNHGIVEIRGGSGTGTVLVLKDSFANCFVPFLMSDYEKVIMVDLRYYSGSVQQLLSSKTIDEVVVLYEMSNFANDSNLVKLVM